MSLCQAHEAESYTNRRGGSSMYQKAEDILPLTLVREIQSYCQGTILYIPKTTRRAAWGTKSGSRGMLDDRNAEIRTFFLKGMSIPKLANKFHLSASSIKKIVYVKE